MWDECGIGLCATMLRMWGKCGIFSGPHNLACWRIGKWVHECHCIGRLIQDCHWIGRWTCNWSEDWSEDWSRIGIGLAKNWKWIGGFVQDWYQIGELALETRLPTHLSSSCVWDWLDQIIRFAEYTQIGQRLVIVWDNGWGYVDVSIVHGLALSWGIRIGRLALDWQIGIGLAYESKFATWLGIGQGLHRFGGLVRDWSRVGIRLEDWSRIGIGLIDW